MFGADARAAALAEGALARAEEMVGVSAKQVMQLEREAEAWRTPGR